MWYELADRRGMEPWQVKEQVTATSFLRWSKFFTGKKTDRDANHYYLAQVAYRLWRLELTWRGGKADKTLDDFLLDFSKPEPEKPLTEEEIEERKKAAAAASKARMFAMVGLGPDGKPRPLRPGQRPPIKPGAGPKNPGLKTPLQQPIRRPKLVGPKPKA